jgi:hypothetical protein
VTPLGGDQNRALRPRLAWAVPLGARAAVDRHDRAGHHRRSRAKHPIDALMRSTTPGVAASHASIISVAVPPGVMPFTRMPSRPQVTAAVSVMLLSARFMAPYAGSSGFAWRPPRLR